MPSLSIFKPSRRIRFAADPRRGVDGRHRGGSGAQGPQFRASEPLHGRLDMKKVSRSPPFCGPEMQVNPLDPFGAHRSSIGFMGHGPRGGLGLCDAEDHAAGAHAGPEARGHLENPRVAALRQAVWSCG